PGTGAGGGRKSEGRRDGVRARVRPAGELFRRRAQAPRPAQGPGGGVMRRPPPPVGGRRVDLHAHTFFSDGLLSPEALVARAIDKHLVALAVTDHDSIEALPRSRAAAGTNLELVPGIELSSSFEGLDLHILGFYLDPDHPGLRARLENFQDERRERAAMILQRLTELGAPVDPEVVFDLAGPGG